MITIKDPRITSYLLGELDSSSSKQIEKAISEDSNLATEVEEMRHGIELLFSSLPQEPLISRKIARTESVWNSPRGRWVRFAVQSCAALFIGLFLYIVLLPTEQSAPSLPSVALNTVGEDVDSLDASEENAPIEELQFFPINALEFQPPVKQTWEEYGFTPESLIPVDDLPENVNPVLQTPDAFLPAAINLKERLKDYYCFQEKGQELYRRVESKTYKGLQASDTVRDEELSNKWVMENPMEYVSARPFSTFNLVSSDVSWSVMEQYIKQTYTLPPEQTVRVDEYINHFDYFLPEPKEEDGPMGVTFEIGPHPWAQGMLLAKIGVQTKSGQEAEIVAQNVSAEVKFNPDLVQAYRLIGYEKRLALDDTTPYKPAVSKEIFANRQVVVLYELVPVIPNCIAQNKQAQPNPKANSSVRPSQLNDGKSTMLGYVPAEAVLRRPAYFSVTLKYNLPESGNFQYEKNFYALESSREELEAASYSPEFRFAAAVALFGQILENSTYTGAATINSVKELLQGAACEDPLQRDFIELLRRTDEIIK